jgi:hypothetical protein
MEGYHVTSVSLSNFLKVSYNKFTTSKEKSLKMFEYCQCAYILHNTAPDTAFNRKV